MADTVSATTEFPSAILANIFHRLPVKSLAVSCCVCKTWGALIKSPPFLSAHLAAALKASLCISSNEAPNPPLLLLRRCPRSAEELYTFHGIPTTATNETQSSHNPVGLPLLQTIPPPPLTAHPGNRFFRVAASCAGAVLLVDDLLHFTHTFVLWNPTTRRILSLPSPPFVRESDDHDTVQFISEGKEEPRKGLCRDRYESCLGLAYDAATSDFKVLRVVMMVWLDEAPVMAELYSVKAGSWPKLKTPHTRYTLSNPRGPMAFCNGYLHYATHATATSHHRGIGGKETHSVMAFHVRSEQFRRIRFPSALAESKFQRYTVFAYHGPAVAASSPSRTTIALFRLVDMLDWELWVMSEYAVPNSWMRLAKYENITISNPLAVFPGFFVGGVLFEEIAGVELHPRRPWSTREVELNLPGKSIIYDEVDGNNRMAEPTCGAVHVETLALSDVGDKSRLVVYGADDRLAAPPPPDTFSTAEELDWDISRLCSQLMFSQFNIDNGELFRFGKW